jgi:hypothetical protein
MSQAFPIYEALSKDVETQQTNSPVDWRRLGTVIGRLPDQDLEIIQALIHHHYLLSQPKGIKTKTPPLYGAKTANRGVGPIYTVSDFPTVLQHIIAAYIKRSVNET